MDSSKNSVVRPALRQISDRPLVTVIIGVYNAGQYFRPSLESILRQSYSNLDIVVIDDGSTDGCIETASDLLTDRRVRLFRQANATRPVALNRGLNQARGEFYATHDADDISHPARIEKQLSALLKKPEVAAVFCGSELLIGGRAMAPLFGAKSEDQCRSAIESLSVPAHDPTGLYRMSLVGQMRYDASLPGAEGIDYILRMGEKYPMVVLGECLYQYRILDTSSTRSDPIRRKKVADEALRRAYERRDLAGTKIVPKQKPLLKWRSKNAFLDNYIAVHFIESVRCQKKANLNLNALKTGIDCLKLHPFDLDYYRPLFFAVAPSIVVRFLSR
jgi:glycosyltransferase involved in cell wall biosynthesis